MDHVDEICLVIKNLKSLISNYKNKHIILLIPPCVSLITYNFTYSPLCLADNVKRVHIRIKLNN